MLQISRVYSIAAVLVLGAARAASQPLLVVGPSDIGFSATADSSPSTSIVQIVITAGDLATGKNLNLPVAFNGVTPSRVGATVPDFLVVSPSTGTTPLTAYVGLNPNIVRSMAPGRYDLTAGFSIVGVSPVSSAGFHVGLLISAAAPPAITSVVSTASYQPMISPGEMVSIFGARIAQSNTTGQYSDAGLFPTTLGGTTVTFGGIAAPLLYVDSGQINTVVPYGVSGQKAVDVVVTHYSQPSPAFTVPLFDTSPAIFTATQNGTGQGAILNVPVSLLSPYTYNSIDNPAPQGSLVEMFATGVGVWNPVAVDGSISLNPTNFSAQPLTLTIGGKPATILYAGTAGYQIFGLLQVTAYVPNGIGTGLQPLVLKIGQNDNSLQAVTIAVK